MRIRLFSIILCIILLLSACTEALNDETTGEDSTVEIEQSAAVTDVKLDGYKIIRPEQCSQSVVSAAVGLKSSLAEFADNIGIGDDWVKPGDELPSEALEILVGDVKRSETEEVMSSLKADDYAVKFFESGRIVICGGSDEATLKAIEYFLEYCVEDATVKRDLSFFSTGEYAVKECILEGASIEEYTIVISNKSNDDEQYAASLIANTVSQKTGVKLTVSTDLKASEGRAIIISSSAISARGVYTVGADGDDIVLYGQGGLVVKAARELLDQLFPAGEATVSLSLGKVKEIEFKRATYPTLNDFGTKPIALADQLNASIAVYDLASGEAEFKYEFKPQKSNGFSLKGYANRIDEARLRYSEKWGTYIMLFTSSSGYCGVASYPEEKCLWEAELGGTSPHSIEYLPNGMVAIASSGGSNADKGFIRLYTAQKKGDKTYAEALLNGAHAILWDETREILWAMGYNDIVAYQIGNGAMPELKVIDCYGSNQMKGGHDFSAMYGNDDMVWVGGSIVRLFDRSTGSMISTYEGSTNIDTSSVKCVCTFNDGDMALTVATGVYASHDTDRFKLFSFNGNSVTAKEYVFAGRAFYKARSFIANYN